MEFHLLRLEDLQLWFQASLLISPPLHKSQQQAVNILGLRHREDPVGGNRFVDMLFHVRIVFVFQFHRGGGELPACPPPWLDELLSSSR